MREECPMSRNKKQRRVRRVFSSQFKSEVVALCQVGDRSIGAVAKDLDLTVTAVRAWVQQAAVKGSTTPTAALTTDEREELTRLRRDNKRLVMEREILKKAATFFAKENS
jgi:transposase